VDNLQWRIGDISVTRVVENLFAVPPTRILPTATEEAFAKHASWLQPHFVDRDGNILLSIHAFGVQTPTHRLVIDTCVGDAPVTPGAEHFRSDTPLLEELAAAGFERHDVDFVICTHMHFDHVGWNTILVDGEYVPTFPNARYIFCRAEWDHFSEATTEYRARTVDQCIRPIVDAGLADFVPPDHPVTDGVRLELTAGHTPGHVTVHLESDGAHAFVTGDLTHNPIQWAYPEWPGPDADPEQASATRRRLLAQYADTTTLVLGTHYAPPCCGRIVREGDGHVFTAVFPEPRPE
jgi:glyoxylase-like metal-dependent hydrolase (beta-lactamase superfamily II)